MKQSIRHGAVIKCDMATVVDEPNIYVVKDACMAPPFTSYSMAPLVRGQAAAAGWGRVKCSRVRWPGAAPGKASKKVDLCPDHAKTHIISVEEAAELRKKARAAAKADRVAGELAARAERDAARADKRMAKAAAKQKRAQERAEREALKIHGPAPRKRRALGEQAAVTP